MCQLEYILVDVIKKVLDHSNNRMPGEVAMYGMYKEKAAQQILDLCLECVGEDEVSSEDLEEKVYIIPARNELRGEIRQRLKEALGGK